MAIARLSRRLKLARFRGHVPLSTEGVPCGPQNLLPAGVLVEDGRPGAVGLGDRRIMLVPFPASRRQSGMTSRRVLPSRRMYRHELGLLIETYRGVLQPARSARALDQRRQRCHEVDAPFYAPTRLFQRSVARESLSHVFNRVQAPNHIIGRSPESRATGNPASKGEVIWEIPV